MYEGMLILPKTLADEALEQVLGRVREEIEKLGGAVKNITRLGKRAFARPLGKQDAGHYAVVGFELDGANMTQLQARLKMNEDVFRVHIVRAEAAVPAPAAAPKEVAS